MKKNKIYEAENISIKKMKELISVYKGVKSKELSSSEEEIYFLNNNQLISKSKYFNSAILYHKKEDYLSFLEELQNKDSKPSHMLTEWQKEIAEIEIDSSKINLILLELATNLGIEINPLNQDLEYLLLLSKKINIYIKKNHFLNIYFPLTVFIAEHIKNKVNGKWLFREQKNLFVENANEFYIIDSEGKEYNPWVLLYKQYDEASKINIPTIISFILDPHILPIYRSEE